MRRGLPARQQLVWAAYDCASTPFTITVIGVFLGPYLTTVTKAAADANGFVHPFGLALAAGSYFSYLVFVSVLLQVICLPLVGMVSDQLHHEKAQFVTYGYVGALAATGLFFVQGQTYLLGGALFVLANVAYGAAFVLYDSFIIDLAPPEGRHALSTLGWSLGVLAGGVLLLLDVVLVGLAPRLGLGLGDAVRTCLGSAGLWWVLFGLIPAVWLKMRRASAVARGSGLSWGELGRAYRSLARYPQGLLFLVAYLLYNDGVQTAIAQSSLFAQEELGVPVSTFALIALALQFIAAGSAVGSYRLAGRLGAKRVVAISLCLWIVAIVYSFGWLRTTAQLVGVAVAFGLAVGGSQALSRSLFSFLVPPGWEANYFGLFMLSSRGTSWLGPLAFGLAYQFSHSYRLAILSVLLFFVSGLALLLRVDVEKGAALAVSREDASSLLAPAGAPPAAAGR